MAFNFLKNLEADDIFISYSREDGEAYLTGIDAALSHKGFSCFTDKHGTDANPLPPETLFRKIRLCKTLVLLATPGALKKPENVAPEVSAFAEANGTSRIICVSFDRGAEFADWAKTPWYTHVEGKPREREDPNALRTGEPSLSVVETITRVSNYMKSKDRLRMYRNRALVGFLCLLVVGLAGSGFAIYGLSQAENARNEAIGARKQADATITKAKEDTQEVVKQTEKDKQQARDDAQKDIKKAQDEAQTEISIANRSVQKAQSEAEEAVAKAITERERAKDLARESASRDKALNAMSAMPTHPLERPERSTQLALQAVEIKDTTQAVDALKQSLLVKSVIFAHRFGGSVKKAAIS